MFWLLLGPSALGVAGCGSRWPDLPGSSPPATQSSARCLGAARAKRDLTCGVLEQGRAMLKYGVKVTVERPSVTTAHSLRSRVCHSLFDQPSPGVGRSN